MRDVLVTTQFQGVFFGSLVEDNAPENVTLTGCRNCLYWDTETQGFLGLTKFGPNQKCRIGAEVEKITLYGITSISDCTEEAAQKWREAKWT